MLLSDPEKGPVANTVTLARTPLNPSLIPDDRASALSNCLACHVLNLVEKDVRTRAFTVLKAAVTVKQYNPRCAMNLADHLKNILSTWLAQTQHQKRGFRGVS